MNIASRLKYISPKCLIKTSNVSTATVLTRLLSSASHYKVLDVPQTATHDEIKKAFFEKSKKFHPDVSPGNPHHHNIFVKLNNAYSILRDKSKRKDYDRSLNQPKPKVYAYQSNVYQDASFYNHGNDPRNAERNSEQHRSDNVKVAIGVLAYMICGTTLCFLVIGYRHKQYKKQLDHNSMKASKLYQESRERSSKYSMQQQLEMLAERQGKVERKR